MRDPLSEEECRALREYIDLTSGDWRTRRALDTVDELREEVEELAEAGWAFPRRLLLGCSLLPVGRSPWDRKRPSPGQSRRF